MTRRRIAWIVILVVDVGCLLWGVGATASPEHLVGPGGKGILPAGYEGYTGGSWSELAAASSPTAAYLTLLFRMYGIYNVLFGLLASVVAATAFRRGERWAWWALLVGNTVALGSAITYDRTVNAIGPFELTEYLWLALVWAALAVSAASLPALRPAAATG
jgi:hypothetical protein